MSRGREEETERQPLRWVARADLTPEERIRIDVQIAGKKARARVWLRHEPVAEIRLKIYGPQEGREPEVYWDVRPPRPFEPYRFTPDDLRELFLRTLADAGRQLGEQDLSRTNIGPSICILCGKTCTVFSLEGDAGSVRVGMLGAGLFRPLICEECHSAITASNRAEAGQ